MIRLKNIAHGRSGDKGNHANIGIVAFTPEGYAFLESELTAGKVKAFFAALVPEAVERFVQLGGKDFYVSTLKPLLPAGAPPFVEPRRLYVHLPLPFELPASPEDAAAKLRPALNGEEMLRRDGAEVPLDVAIIIPKDIARTASAGA